jgi:hypothetical protein
MTPERQIQIAESFSTEFAEAELDINLTECEFGLLGKGIFASSMDEKWNVFVVDGFLYLARSWSDKCIYKVSYKVNGPTTKLNQLRVTRNSFEYRSTDLISDTNMFKKVLQMYLNRIDIYSDDRINLPLIKKTLEKYSGQNELKKSVGSQSIELNLSIYDSLLKSNTKYLDITGLEELKTALKKYESEYEILSLHIFNNSNPNSSKTYFFNQEGTEMLGEIIVQKKASR